MNCFYKTKKLAIKKVIIRTRPPLIANHELKDPNINIKGGIEGGFS